MRSSRVTGIVLPTALVTVRVDDGFDMAPVLELWQDNADLFQHGSGALVHGLLDVIVDSHFDTIQQLDDTVEELEDILFDQRRTGRRVRPRRVPAAQGPGPAAPAGAADA